MVPAMFGLLGALCLEGYELSKAIIRVADWPWRRPDEPALGPYLTAVAIRVTVSAVYASVIVTADGAGSALRGFISGVTAPLAIEWLVKERTRAGIADKGETASSGLRQ